MAGRSSTAIGGTLDVMTGADAGDGQRRAAADLLADCCTLDGLRDRGRCLGDGAEALAG